MQRLAKYFLAVLAITWLAGAAIADATSGFLKTGAGYSSFDYPGAVNTYAYGINNAGQIVGYYVGYYSDGSGKYMQLFKDRCRLYLH